MIAAVLGYPFSGHDDLAQGLVARGLECSTFGSAELRTLIQTSKSDAASDARVLVASGRLIPTDLMGRLLAEGAASAQAHVLFVGYPRGIDHLLAIQNRTGELLRVVYMRASIRLVDERRQRLHFASVEGSHPGALARIDAALAPILAACADRLLSLDASMPLEALVDSAARFLAAPDAAQKGFRRT